MSSGVTLSAGVRANLLSLQDTANMMQTTQNRLATGKKVNSALDNPLNFFTSSSLSSRASDLGGLLDSMSNGIQTIQAANNGLTAVTSLVQQLQATVSQARSDATTEGAVAGTPGTKEVTGSDTSGNTSSGANNKLTFDIGGGVKVSVTTATHTNATVSTLGGSTAVVETTDYSTGIATGQLTINDGAHTADINMMALDGKGTKQNVVDAINAGLKTAGSTVQATLDANSKIQLVNNTGDTITVGGTGALGLGFGANNTLSTDGATAKDAQLTLTQLAASINSNTELAGKVSATLTYDSTTKLMSGMTLNNLSTTTDVGVTGWNNSKVTGAAADTTSIGHGSGGSISSVRQSLMNQFNSLMTQIDKATTDSGYNGINLLNGDTLKLSFNENGTSSIDVATKDSTGASFAINSANLGITTGSASQFGANAQLDTLSTNLTTSLTKLRTQASALGSSLSVVQTRQDFTKAMINTLQTGADNLVLADSNQEGANLLALQTRQSLSTTALSLSAQADKNVLQLFQ